MTMLLPPQQQVSPKKPSMKVALQAVFILWRAMPWPGRGLSTDQQANLVAQWQLLGIPEDRIGPLKILLKVFSAIAVDRGPGYRLDRYLGGGCAVLDLVLFQMLASIPLTDIPLHVAWLAFVCSLPCTAGFLVFCFLRPQMAEKHYGGIHIALSLVSVLGAFVAVVAFTWHLWMFAGSLLLVMGLVVGFLCFGYALLLQLATHLIPVLPVQVPVDPTNAVDQDDTDTLYG